MGGRVEIHRGKCKPGARRLRHKADYTGDDDQCNGAKDEEALAYPELLELSASFADAEALLRHYVARLRRAVMVVAPARDNTGFPCCGSGLNLTGGNLGLHVSGKGEIDLSFPPPREGKEKGRQEQGLIPCTVTAYELSPLTDFVHTLCNATVTQGLLCQLLRSVDRREVRSRAQRDRLGIGCAATAGRNSSKTCGKSGEGDEFEGFHKNKCLKIQIRRHQRSLLGLAV